MQNYNWNYEEEAEIASSVESRKSTLIANNPHFNLFFMAHTSMPPNLFNVDLDVFEELSPNVLPEIPAHLSLIACAITNRNVEQASAWILKFKELISTNKYNSLIADALNQISKRYIPINALPLQIIDVIFSTLNHELPVSPQNISTQLLLDLFRMKDSEYILDEALYFLHCKFFLAHGANPQGRDPKGHSPLSMINALLLESEISMINDRKIHDLILCAELLLEQGAHPDSVRIIEPLDNIVSNLTFKTLLSSYSEKKIILETLENHPNKVIDSLEKTTHSTRL